mgnify:CR=1 FL=1
MRPRKLARIARWEVSKNAGGVDLRTILIAGIVIVAMGGVAGLALGGESQGLDSGIYRIGVDESSPYYAPAADNPSFSVREPVRGGTSADRFELRYRGTALVERSYTTKGDAALSEFRETVERWNDRRMAAVAADGNRSAAFPVSVTLSYAERAETDSSGDGATGGGGTNEDGGAGGSGDGDGGGTSDGDGTSAGAGNGDAGGGTGGVNPEAGGSLGGLGGGLTGGTTTGSPADISPPFPFESLVLAFLFVVPLNFVIQAYGSSMLSERLNRRGELLLVSPVSRGDIIAGKTLPYLAVTVGVVSVITIALRVGGFTASGGPIAVLAILPIALLFLAATFCGAMFARSFKELTFVTVTITVSLTSYAFVPAIFTDVHPVALISPLTLVVRDLQGQAIPLLDFLYSTTPPTLTALLLFGLGAGLSREEDLFTQRPIPLKVLDALAGQISSSRSALKLSVFLMPLVIVAELVAVALLFALGELSVFLILGVVAIIEEVAKSLHLYAGYAHARYERTLRSVVWVGALSGLGFFLAEKLLAVAQVVGLNDVQTGRAAMVTGIVPEGIPLIVVLAVALLGPFLLHVVTAVISSVGASRSRVQYGIALSTAIIVHLAYNLTVVTVLVP